MASDFASSPLSAITAQLEALVQRHDFKSISIGLNTDQRDESRYDAALHYDLPSGRRSCAIGHGPSLAAALNSANRTRIKECGLDVLVDEAA